MAIGDVRKCSFCLNEYIVTKTYKLSECCATCRERHRKSKKGNIKKDNMNVSYQKFALASARKKVKISKVDKCMNPVPALNWGAKK